jgi:hypothetical protein
MAGAPDMIAVPTRADFEARVGEDFDIAAQGVALRLKDVRALGAALREGGAR